VKDTIRYNSWFNQVSDGPPNMPLFLAWKKINHGWLKCNVDGDLFSANRSFGIGICFRDSLGQFIHALAHSRCFPIAAESEATALHVVI